MSGLSGERERMYLISLKVEMIGGVGYNCRKENSFNKVTVLVEGKGCYVYFTFGYYKK